SREYSTGFSYADQSQEYNDLVGSVRNPLGSYSDHYADDISGRATLFTVVSNTPSEAVIDMVSVEPIFMNPWYFGKTEANLGGTVFIGLINIDFNFTFISNSWARMWSHANGGLNVGGPIMADKLLLITSLILMLLLSLMLINPLH